jgi:hypothetical protein
MRRWLIVAGVALLLVAAVLGFVYYVSSNQTIGGPGSGY